jgi:acetyl coenzyme A synthetase (ADP forming)-like protein
MRSLDVIFRPRSVAVIGATPRPGSIGREIVHNLFEYEFNGKIFPVNPNYEFIHSTKAYPSVEQIPDEVDLAIIVVPARFVAETVEACGRKGVRGLVIISAGFREIGEEGLRREEQIIEIAQRHGMRMIGPNCMGVINATADIRMNATFSPGIPPTGSMSFMTQSGALGVAILHAVRKLGIGIAHFASVGNKADIGAMDVLEYWDDEPNTNLIAMYLESFGDPRRFTELSKRISRKKPVVVVKSGTSAAGARAASSHTGSLAGLEVASEALLRQCGVIRVTTIEEMIHVINGFARAPIPEGNRLLILTNAGGPAIMAADAADGHGLQIATLSDDTKKRIRKLVAPEASVENPIDMIAGAQPEQYGQVLEIALADPGVDLAIAIFVPPIIIDPLDVIGRVTRAARASGKPVFQVLMAQESDYERIPTEIPDAVPIFRYPEDAVAVAEHMNRYRLWHARPAGETRTFPVDVARARAPIDEKRRAGGGYLSPEDAHAVLEAYGFPLVHQAVVPVSGDVVAAAANLAFPVVLKVVGETIVHKSDVGGVIVGIEDAKALGAARREMETALKDAGVLDRASGFLVQEMAGGPAPCAGDRTNGRQEVILGVAQDPKFGPLLMFGMGGRYVEIMRDVAFSVVPMTDIDAQEMVRSIRSFPILEGVRGEPRVDIEFIEEMILRLAQLVHDFEGIAELDMNPVIVTSKRADCRVVDVRIKVTTG